jgi:hypothetical protein
MWDYVTPGLLCYFLKHRRRVIPSKYAYLY